LALYPSRNRPVPPPRIRAVVFAVGQRVFVNCPGASPGWVALEDDSGKVHSSVHLTDGVEVEVIAWRPRGPTDTRYRVRRRSDGADGWLSCGNLRTALEPTPAPEKAESPSSAALGGDDVRPFGQRSYARQAPVAQAVPAAAPTAASDGRGRRFGQHF
jgi:hypothetical protein